MSHFESFPQSVPKNVNALKISKMCEKYTNHLKNTFCESFGKVYRKDQWWSIV